MENQTSVENIKNNTEKGNEMKAAYNYHCIQCKKLMVSSPIPANVENTCIICEHKRIEEALSRQREKLNMDLEKNKKDIENKKYSLKNKKKK